MANSLSNHEVHEGSKGHEVLDAAVEAAARQAVEALSRLHEAQLMTYLKLSGRRLGLLMNFNVELFKHGLRRLVS